MKRCVIALLTALIMLLPAIAFADGVFGISIPLAEYNEHDLQKLTAFLSQEDENGVSNGEALYGESYDPARDIPGMWNADGRLIDLSLVPNAPFVGELDLSDCTALENLLVFCGRITAVDTTGCSSLTFLELDPEDTGGSVGSLKLAGCESLTYLYASYEKLTELDLSDCGSLTMLACSYNELTELDLTGCPSLMHLNCSYNRIEELDLNCCEQLQLFSECSGLKRLYYKGTEFTGENCTLTFALLKAISPGDGDRITAVGNEGRAFVGWKDNDHVLLSSHASVDPAVFEGETKVTAICALEINVDPVTESPDPSSAPDPTLNVVIYPTATAAPTAKPAETPTAEPTEKPTAEPAAQSTDQGEAPGDNSSGGIGAKKRVLGIVLICAALAVGETAAIIWNAKRRG